ncbi:hypothetical protein GCM10018965_037220 [Nonomuraea roseola]
MAIASGGSPARMAGITNSSSRVKVTPRPTSAVTPRQRPNATTASAKAAPMIHSDVDRSWSESRYGDGVERAVRGVNEHDVVALPKPGRLVLGTGGGGGGEAGAGGGGRGGGRWGSGGGGG